MPEGGSGTALASGASVSCPPTQHMCECTCYWPSVVDTKGDSWIGSLTVELLCWFKF